MSSESTAMEPDADGYTKALSKRQVQMIAIGGAIGVGFFLGAGGRLAQSGPALRLDVLGQLGDDRPRWPCWWRSTCSR